MIIITTSLNPESSGRRIAHFINETYPNAEIIDLFEYILPHSNGVGQSAYACPKLKELHDKLIDVPGFIIVAPIYNWMVGSCAKNFIELLGTPYKDILSGKVFTNKVIGFIGACGTPLSLLAPLSFLNSMMVDFQSFIVPKYGLISKGDWEEDLMKQSGKDTIDLTIRYFDECIKCLSGFKI